MSAETESQSYLEEPIAGRLRERLEQLATRHMELEQKIAEPSIQQDRGRFQELLREHGATTEQVQLYSSYKKAAQDVAEAQLYLEGGDPELAELARAELHGLDAEQRRAARALREYILDQQIEGANEVIVEIRAGTGGDEAALFASDVFKMYSLYCERRRWKVEVLDLSETPLGGYREIIFGVKGKDVLQRLRFESGGHRVQRVPTTEAQGRIHTSAITVAVLQEAEESEVELLDKDLRIDTFCASGPGGQKVNKTASAVRITHLPTGLVVSIQDEKSQHKNKAKALRVLRSRLKEKQDSERRAKEDAVRRDLIGTGDRSDRIRTYNFPQNRVTDHRINFSLYDLQSVLGGGLDPLIDRLIGYDREQRVQYL